MDTTETGPISAHGGELVDRFLPAEERKEWRERRTELPSIELSDRQESDLEMITVGAFSPLKGFMGPADHDSVVRDMQLKDGTLWPIPITLSVSSEKAEELPDSGPVALENANQEFLAILHLDETYEISKQRRAREVFQTAEKEHPGVDVTFRMGEVCLSGEIDTLKLSEDRSFPDYRLPPTRTRELFRERGWKSVVGFQTRNPMHRAHEYLVKCALENVDGLLIHPLVGDTKSGDVPAEVRMNCYEAMMEHYFPRDRVALSVMPAKMNYAGPREALLHALIRQNYGCTHFIVGRDHAGVGDYYDTYAAQDIFRGLGGSDLAIQPVFFDFAFWCEQCGNMASKKTCPHDAEHHLYLSGTRVREMLREGETLPPEFSRPEVAQILQEAYRSRRSSPSRVSS